MRVAVQYWLAGFVLWITGALMLWLASVPAKVVSSMAGGGSGPVVLDQWWKWLIALFELIVFPSAFGWLMHRVVANRNSMVSQILGDWISENAPGPQMKDAEPATEGDVQ